MSAQVDVDRPEETMDCITLVEAWGVSESEPDRLEVKCLAYDNQGEVRDPGFCLPQPTAKIAVILFRCGAEGLPVTSVGDEEIARLYRHLNDLVVEGWRVLQFPWKDSSLDGVPTLLDVQILKAQVEQEVLKEKEVRALDRIDRRIVTMAYQTGLTFSLDETMDVANIDRAPALRRLKRLVALNWLKERQGIGNMCYELHRSRFYGYPVPFQLPDPMERWKYEEDEDEVWN
ncbi:MAG: hypothetical protein OWU32_08220 [Firmicutes bacterium]|nr:hypothetical protein [Bacillota bacterium]